MDLGELLKGMGRFVRAHHIESYASARASTPGEVTHDRHKVYRVLYRIKCDNFLHSNIKSLNSSKLFTVTFFKPLEPSVYCKHRPFYRTKTPHIAQRICLSASYGSHNMLQFVPYLTVTDF